MVDVRGDVLRPPHGTTPAAVKSNIKSEMRSFKSNENIHKKEGGSYYVVSANKVFLQEDGMWTFFNLYTLDLHKNFDVKTFNVQTHGKYWPYL